MSEGPKIIQVGEKPPIVITVTWTPPAVDHPQAQANMKIEVSQPVSPLLATQILYDAMRGPLVNIREAETPQVNSPIARMRN